MVKTVESVIYLRAESSMRVFAKRKARAWPVFQKAQREGPASLCQTGRGASCFTSRKGWETGVLVWIWRLGTGVIFRNADANGNAGP